MNHCGGSRTAGLSEGLLGGAADGMTVEGDHSTSGIPYNLGGTLLSTALLGGSRPERAFVSLGTVVHDPRDHPLRRAGCGAIAQRVYAGRSPRSGHSLHTL